MNGFAKMRVAANLLQEEAAASLQVDRSTVSKWETGDSRPRADKLLAIANLYGCNVSDLLADTDDDDKTEAV